MHLRHVMWQWARATFLGVDWTIAGRFGVRVYRRLGISMPVLYCVCRYEMLRADFGFGDGRPCWECLSNEYDPTGMPFRLKWPTLLIGWDLFSRKCPFISQTGVGGYRRCRIKFKSRRRGESGRCSRSIKTLSQ